MFSFNRKVLIGLGVAAIGVLAFAPQAFSRILPLLLVAACPLSMLFMMRGMSGSGAPCRSGKAGAGGVRDEEAEISHLRAEVTRLRAERLASMTTTPAEEADAPRSTPCS
ncbi:MAG: DUF2933 domain-containing protein [Actinomycetota bacterium]